MALSPRGERLKISIFGPRNSGKSSLINTLTGQELAIVSEEAGTTTDPVSKAYELHPIGPVELVDTAGLDEDRSELGQARVKRSLRELETSSLVLAVISASDFEPGLEVFKTISQKARDLGLPCLAIINKIDLLAPSELEGLKRRLLRASPGLKSGELLGLSAKSGEGVEELKKRIVALAKAGQGEKLILEGLIKPKELALLVTPIDSGAPKGRLILPQVQVMRELLDLGAGFLTCQPGELSEFLARLKSPPRIVITDSQVFDQVARDLPEEQELTSFSILFARYKGELKRYLAGIEALARLKAGDRIMIAENCSHHQQCEDIGRVKLPRWLNEKTGLELAYDHLSGSDFPEELSPWALVIQCGGCMATGPEILGRIELAHRQAVPITNYGLVIAWRFGILERAVRPFRSIP